MRNFLPLLLAVSVLAACKPSSKKTGEDTTYQYHGATFTPANAKTVSEAIAAYNAGSLTKGKAYSGEEVDGIAMQMKGSITSVCRHAGCWIDMADTQDTVFVKFGDEAFAVPTDMATGGEGVVNGFFYASVTSVDELKHFAKDEGKSAEEIAKITAPLTEYKFNASGIAIKK